MKPMIGVPMDLIHDIDCIMSGGLPDMMIADTPMETIDGIRAGGGMAVGLPLVCGEEQAMEVCRRIDGLVVPVGQDLSPEASGVPVNGHSGVFCVKKDRSDIYYIKAMKALDKPILGLCRGMQLMNAAAGGSMIKHLPDILDESVVHSSPVVSTDYILHQVWIEENTQLALVYGTKEPVNVNSFHHMAIERPGEGYIVAARSRDGVIEAIEDESGKRIGVQWHPECLFKEREEHRKLFERFVELAREGMK